MRRAAFTLIEMLVSLVITLMMMGAAVSLFQLISDSVSGSRAIIETQERMRAARNTIQADLNGLTVGTVLPPLKPENDEGYLVIGEGQKQDWNYSADPVLSMFGDCDDVLMLTTRSKGDPFVGR